MTRKSGMIQLKQAMAAAAVVAAPLLGARACDTPLPASAGLCHIIAGSMTFTGGSTIASATVICAQKPEEFHIAAQIQARRGKAWHPLGTSHSSLPPAAGDLHGRQYRMRTSCVDNTSERAVVQLTARFDGHTRAAEIDYPSSRGRKTGNCDRPKS
jgi:hypothetical protein